MIFYLIYRSIASYQLNGEEFEDLLLTSQINNKQFGITGILIHRNGIYIQYIEGKKTEVMILFERILDDRRHFQVEVLQYGFQNKIKFEYWSMKLIELKYKQILELTGVTTKRESQGIMNSSIDALLKRLKNGNTKADWQN